MFCLRFRLNLALSPLNCDIALFLPDCSSGPMLIRPRTAALSEDLAMLTRYGAPYWQGPVSIAKAQGGYCDVSSWLSAGSIIPAQWGRERKYCLSRRGTAARSDQREFAGPRGVT